MKAGDRIKLAAKAFWYVLRGHQVVYRAVIDREIGLVIPAGEKAMVDSCNIRSKKIGIFIDGGGGPFHVGNTRLAIRRDEAK